MSAIESTTMGEYLKSGKAAEVQAATAAHAARSLSVQTMANYVKTGVVVSPGPEVLGTMSMGEYIAQGSTAPIEAGDIVQPDTEPEPEAPKAVKKAAKKAAAKS